MNPQLKRVFGLLLVIVSILSLIISAGGVIALWGARPAITTALQDTVKLVSETLATTQKALAVADAALQNAADTITVLSGSIDSLGNSIGGTQDALNSVTTLVRQDLPKTIEAARTALASAQDSGSRLTLLQLHAGVSRRLGEIRDEQQAEVSRVEGSKAHWRELDREFQSMVRGLDPRLPIPEELRQHLAQFEPDGSLSGLLLRYLEANGEFYVDGAGRGPWISLSLVDGETHSTGLSRSQVLAGDPGLAVLILAAVIDYNLSQSEARREDIGYMDAMFALFRQASDTAGRHTGGE